MKKATLIMIIALFVYGCNTNGSSVVVKSSDNTQLPKDVSSLSISQITILVKDQLEAMDYYTRKLGFSVKMNDTTTIQGFRYLEIGYANGTNIVLVKAESPRDIDLIGKGTTTVINTINFQTDYDKMKANGIKFEGEPETLPWGRSAVFTDLYGNPFNLVEHTN